MKKPVLAVLTGAGISAESGLRTFRDSDGLWEGYNVEDVATPRAFARNPEMVLRFYNERRKNVLAAKPNKAHFVIAALEKYFEVRIITQNIDDLHERAGSTNVLHLHGEIFKMRSIHDDTKTYPITSDIELGDVNEQGYQLRPAIVWFEEAVPAIEEAVLQLQDIDYFLLVGTSLIVYPAAGLIDYVDPAIPKYVVDKSIPPVSRFQYIITVEKPATEGLVEVADMLLSAIGVQDDFLLNLSS